MKTTWDTSNIRSLASFSARHMFLVLCKRILIICHGCPRLVVSKTCQPLRLIRRDFSEEQGGCWGASFRAPRGQSVGKSRLRGSVAAANTP